MSNIGKRFAEPAVWEKEYFEELDLKQRLYLLYLNNRCDLAGVHGKPYPVDSGFLGFNINQSFIDLFLKAVNSDSERVISIGDRRLWLVNFVRYQQTGKNRDCLSAKSPPHKSIVGKLKEHELFELAVEKDPELYKEFTGEIPNPPTDASSTDSKGKPTLRQEYAKGYSSNHSNGSNKGRGISPKNSSSQSNSSTANLEKEATVIYKTLRKNVGELALTDVGTLTFEKDIDAILEELSQSDIKNPNEYLLNQMQNVDWIETSWQEFKEQLLAVEETPF